LALLIDLLVAYNWTWQFIGDFSRFAKTPAAGTWGPFLGANLAQYWWFSVGAFGVVYLAVTNQRGRALGATIVLLTLTNGGCTRVATGSGMTRAGLPARGGEHGGTASVARTCGGAYDPERGSNFASCGARRIKYYPRGGHR
jgi:hypothetical protein